MTAPVVLRHDGDTLRVALFGRLTAEVCPELRGVLLEPRQEREQLVLVDAASVTAVDDAVIAVLLAGAAYVSSTGGRLRMASVSASLRRALDVLGVAALLPVVQQGAPRQVDEPADNALWQVPVPRASVEQVSPSLF